MSEEEKHYLADILLTNLSRNTKTLAVQFVGNNSVKISVLWEWLSTAKDPLKWRSAWVFEEICLTQPSVLSFYLREIAGVFPKLEHVPSRRMLGHLLAESVIPEEFEGEVLDAALKWLQDPEQPIAVRVQCMSIVYNLSKKYPELQQELKAILLYWYNTGSAGFKNRASKILARIG